MVARMVPQETIWFVILDRFRAATMLVNFGTWSFRSILVSLKVPLRVTMRLALPQQSLAAIS